MQSGYVRKYYICWIARENKYLNEVIPAFYRREVLHVMIFTYIDALKFIQPSFTIMEAAQSFMKRHKIDEELYPADTIVTMYYSISKDLINAQKSGSK